MKRFLFTITLLLGLVFSLNAETNFEKIDSYPCSEEKWEKYMNANLYVGVATRFDTKWDLFNEKIVKEAKKTDKHCVLIFNEHNDKSYGAFYILCNEDEAYRLYHNIQILFKTDKVDYYKVY